MKYNVVTFLKKGASGEVSGFFEQVYQLVEQIPSGQVATYGQIAALLGRPRAGRLVGWAMRGAPSHRNLPCHRVVNRNGTLAPEGIFAPGLQRALLEAEGVDFTADGRINLDRRLWRDHPSR
jgi:methylated-DNA-protein-cysteine methyltransferase-like protein